MALKTVINTTLVLSLIALFVFSQQRFGDEFLGKFKGFTKSPTEHIMHEYNGIPELRSVCGQITEASSGVGLPGALFEIRKDDPNDAVRGTFTNKKGEFHLQSVRDGMYVFKVTKDGFQSVYGKLKVHSKSKSNEILKIELEHGV